MPAERSRPPKKEEGEGIQLTWTTPVDMSAPPQHIAFAPAVTPGSYTETCSFDDFEAIPALFPSTPDGASPRKPGHGKKKGDNHIPRPPNAFILFRSSFVKSQHVSTEVETNHSTLSKIIGLTWQNMPNEERQFWHSKAKAAQAEHKRKWPDYAFRPLHAKVKGGTEKRKVREVGPKDMKRCAKIAELLVEGKKGADLQAAVKEFDRDHVPQIVTRFETPITARMFRRSSSEPAPDTDPAAPAFLVSPKRPSRRVRAVSSQPADSRPTPAVKPESSASPTRIPDAVDFHDDEMYRDMPPLIVRPASDYSSTSSSRQLPSFDFDTFIFQDAPAAPYFDSCDPLSPAPSDDVYGMMSTEQQSPCPQGEFQPTLSVNTFESWSASSSSFPTTPSSPISYSDYPFPTEVPSGTAPYNPYHMMDQLGAYSSGYDRTGAAGAALAAPDYPGDPSAYSGGADALAPPVMEDNYYLPLKGHLPYFSYKLPELAHLDVSNMSDIHHLAPPVSDYTY